jgi:predicted Zn-dependent protease
MAKKKVNVKFLIALTVVVGGLTLVGFAAVLFHYSRTSSAGLQQRSAKAEAEGKLPEAANFMALAAVKDSSNKDLFMRAGDLFERCVVIDPAYMGSANQQYRRVLEVDATYQPAIKHLLGTAVAELHNGASGTQFYSDLKRLADQAVFSDPRNPEYQIYTHVATLLQWMYGSTRADASTDKEVQALKKLAGDNPDVADGAYYLSLAQVRIAIDLRANGDIDPAHVLFDEILARHKTATAALPKNPEVQWRGALIFAQLHDAEDRPDHRTEDEALINASVAAARSAVKPTDRAYGDVQTLTAAWLRNQKAPADQIENVYRGWAAAQPHDPRARYELANYLGYIPEKRAQAVELLSKPLETDPQARGYAVLRMRGFGRSTLLLLNNLRAQDAANLQGKQRDELLAVIDSDLARIASMGSSEDPFYLKLRGKSQMLHGNVVEAIKSFERATAAMGSQGSPVDFEHLDLWSQLHQAYLRTGQTGTAQRMMEDLLNRAPGFTELRLRLAALYLSTGQPDKARQQVAVLQANPPTDPNLAKEFEQLKLAVAVQQNDAKTIDSLPEATREQKLQKAQALAQATRLDDASRLFQDVLQKDPGEPSAVMGMVDLYMRQKNPSQAKQILTDAVKANPANQAFKTVLDRLNINSPDAFRQYQDSLVGGIADPLTRALRKAELALQRGEFAAAENSLGEADKIAPNDLRLLLAHVQVLTTQKKFDQTTPWLDRVASANADGMGGLMIRTEVALLRGDTPAALKGGRDLVTNYGEFAHNWVLLGNAQQAASQFADALNSFDQALQRQSNSLEAFRGKIGALEAIGEFADEKSTINQARSFAPRDTGLRDLAMNWELRHGDPDLVLDQCKQILKDEPENAAVYAGLGQAALVTARSKYAGDPPAALNRLNLAKNTLREGMVKFGATPEVLRLYAPLANVLDALGDVTGAEQALQQYAAHPLMKDKPDARVELARLYERRGSLPSAEEAWRTAYATSHQSVDLQIQYAQFLLRQAKSDEALKILAGANASEPRVQNQRIEALLGARRFDDAEKAMAEAYGKNPATASGLFYRGLVRLSRDQAQYAIDDFAAAKDLDPRNPVVQLWLGRALIKAGRISDATSQLEDALRRNASRDDVRMLLLDAYQGTSPPRWDDFDRIVKDALANPSLKVNPAWYQRYAGALSQRGNFAAAREQVAAAQRLAPNSMDVRDELVNIDIQAKDWAAVILETDQQLAAGYKKPVVYGKRGIARARTGDKNAALTEFDTALAGYETAKNSDGMADILRTMATVLSPSDAYSRLSRIPDPAAKALLGVELYGLQNDWKAQAEAAQTALDGAVTLNSLQRAKLLRTAADAHIVLKDWGKARLNLEDLAGIRPDDVTTLNDLAYLIATIQNRPVDAKPFSKRAYDIARNTGNTSVMDTHGWVLTQCGGNDLQQGIGILQDLVDSNQDFIVARYHLGVAYLRQGTWQRAGEELDKVKQQMQQMEKNKRPVPDEIKAGLPRALDEVRQKSGQARRGIGQ